MCTIQSLYYPSIASQVQTGATPPGTSHLHPHPDVRYVSSLDVSAHVMRREMDVSMTFVGGLMHNNT